MVDTHESVKVGDSEKNMESRKVMKPKFTTDFPEEGADELTLRCEEEGMLRTFIDNTAKTARTAEMPKFSERTLHRTEFATI